MKVQIDLGFKWEVGKLNLVDAEKGGMTADKHGY